MNLLNDYEENYLTGWISIFRSTQYKGWYKKSEFVHLWLHILIKANHKRNEFWFNGQNVIVERGQFVTGRKKLSEETGISTGKIERILKTFENEQQIGQQKTNRNRLITVLNYDTYQTSGQQNKQQADNKRTTTEQQADTNNNVNNINNLYSESDFLKDWKNVREKIDNKETNISKLTLYEKQDFNILLKEFSVDDFRNAMLGMFKQKNMFPTSRLRPTHFLKERNIEKYLDCFNNNKQLFENKQNQPRL